MNACMDQENAMTFRRAKITRGGRVTIPAEFREALGLREGDSVMLELDGKGLHIMRPEDVVVPTAGVFTDYAQNGPDFDRDEVWDGIIRSDIQSCSRMSDADTGNQVRR